MHFCVINLKNVQVKDLIPFCHPYIFAKTNRSVGSKNNTYLTLKIFEMKDESYNIDMK